MASQNSIAQANWEMTNNILEVNASEEIYKYDRVQQQSMLSAKPWEKDPHFFKEIKISALALLKMVMHARYANLFQSWLKWTNRQVDLFLQVWR